MELKDRSQSHRDLGGDATDGRFRRVPTHLDRFLTAQRRALRLRTLQGGGAAIFQVHRAGPSAVALWGSCVHGLADTRLHQLRIMAAHAEGRLPRGASTALFLGCVKRGWRRDPLVITSADSVKQYGEVLWDGLLSATVLQSLFEDGAKQAAKERPWVSCRDPVAALIISAQRVGWRLTGPTRAVDDLARPACVVDPIQHSARRASDVRALSLQDRSGWRAPFSGGRFSNPCFVTGSLAGKSTSSQLCEG